MLTDNPSAPLLLIVEDDDGDVHLIRQAFDDADDDYRLEVVGTLLEASRAMERQPPAAILANYQLPDGHGSELVARVNEACPIIVMTSQGDERLAVTTFAGAYHYISKSLDAFGLLPHLVKMTLREWHLLLERKKIYRAVSRGKREWEQTFDAVPDLILIIDTNHTISRVNRAMADRCGLKPGDLPGRKCYEVFHDLSSPPDFCPYLRLIQEGREQTEEIEEKWLAGFFNITVSPLYKDDGSLMACVHVARDMTERRKVEQEKLELEHQLQQAQKLESLGVLAGGIAHDFNNILMIILGHCFLAKDVDDPGAIKENHLTQVEEAAYRAADLCRQMLTYAGKTSLLQTQIDLRLLVEETLRMLKPTLKRNVSFEVQLQDQVRQITGDRAKIQQVIINLILNAVEAIGRKSGLVRVALENRTVASGTEDKDFLGSAIAAGSYACLEVSDNGCGMDEATRHRIFEPFFTTKFTGRGLGMSAILGIVRSHNGVLQLSSTPGIGTTFKFLLPVEEAADCIEITQAPGLGTDAQWRSENGANRRILLVDDEEELRKVGAEMLKGMGFSVITACNGREALETYSAEGQFDLIFMDLTMPEMDGLEAYHELRKTAPAVPIVICSGYGNHQISTHIGDDGHARFMPKPYRPDQVRKMLTTLLDLG